MSSFICGICGAEILDSPQGYVTECPHHHMSERGPKALKSEIPKHRPKRTGRKSWIVEARSENLTSWLQEWFCYRSYSTEARARQAVEALNKSHRGIKMAFRCRQRG